MAALKILVAENGIQGLEISGPLSGHLEALRVGEAIMPAMALLDAMLKDRASITPPTRRSRPAPKVRREAQG
jgi:hypothetical protein